MRHAESISGSIFGKSVDASVSEGVYFGLHRSQGRLVFVLPTYCINPLTGGAAHAAGVRPGDNVSGINGRIPMGYTQVMGSLPTAPRPVRITFTRGHGATLSPGGTVKKSHASTWASNAVTAGVSHPAGDK